MTDQNSSPAGSGGSREDEPEATDPEGTPKPDGLGEDGTIPREPDGVAAGHTGTASTFEPEEDEQVE